MAVPVAILQGVGHFAIAWLLIVGIFLGEDVHWAPPDAFKEDYFRVLAVADSQTDATFFVEFMLGALRYALREVVSTDHVGDQVTDQVAALFRAIGTGELGSNDLMQALGLSHRPTFRNNHLNPAMEDEWIERTQPDSPRSPAQRYRLTGKGHRWLQHHADE